MKLWIVEVERTGSATVVVAAPDDWAARKLAVRLADLDDEEPTADARELAGEELPDGWEENDHAFSEGSGLSGRGKGTKTIAEWRRVVEVDAAAAARLAWFKKHQGDLFTGAKA